MVFDNIEATFEFDPCTNYLCDLQASCTGCDPAAILSSDPWTPIKHNEIMKPFVSFQLSKLCQRQA